MSSISIYQSVTDLNDSQLETLVSDCQNIISRGKRAAVELCIKMAETDDYIKTLPKKNQKEKRLMIINHLDVLEKTYFKYARVGRHVKENPALQDMSMDAIIAQMRPPKQLAAPTQKPPKVDKDQMIKDHEKRIRDLEHKVKELENEVDYRKEEVGDLRGWLDKNTRSGSVGVYEKLGRMLH
jgi:NifB/MoaA-like Fe-S oxidoreductase